MRYTEYVSQRIADLARFRALQPHRKPIDRAIDLCSVAAKTGKLAFYIKKRIGEIVGRKLSWAEADLLADLLWSEAYKLAASSTTELEDNMIDVLKITSLKDRKQVRQEIKLIASETKRRF